MVQYHNKYMDSLFRQHLLADFLRRATARFYNFTFSVLARR